MKSKYHAHIKSAERFIQRRKKPESRAQGFREDRPVPMTKRIAKYPPFKVEG